MEVAAVSSCSTGLREALWTVWGMCKWQSSTRFWGCTAASLLPRIDEMYKWQSIAECSEVHRRFPFRVELRK